MGFHMPISPHPLGFVCLFLFWHQRLEPSIDVVSKSNSERFFYDAASTIDYSKEPLNAGVVDSHRPSKSFDNRRPRHRSRASIATPSGRLLLNESGVLHLNDGYVWTRDLQRVHTYQFLCGTFCHSPRIQTQMPIVPR
jgi:hypothetical protein